MPANAFEWFFIDADPPAILRDFPGFLVFLGFVGIDWVPKVSEKMAYSGLFWCFRRISGFFLKIGNFGVSEASPINTDVFVERANVPQGHHHARPTLGAWPRQRLSFYGLTHFWLNNLDNGCSSVTLRALLGSRKNR